MLRSHMARRCGWITCLALIAIAVPAFGQEVLYRLNAGGSWYTDTAGQLWEPDSGFRQYGYVGLTSAPIGGTLDDKIYQSERWGAPWEPEFAYHLPVPPGTYTVRLHFAEIYDGITAGNPRVFDVLLEGYLALDDYDILATVGFATAAVEEFEVVVADTELDIEFVRVEENPKISAIEVLTSAGPQPEPELTISPPQLVFGDVAVGTTAADSANLTNTGDATLAISAITVGGGNPASFAVQHSALPISLVPGASTTLGVTFTPEAEGPQSASISLVSNDPAGAKTLLASGVGIGEPVAVWRINAGGPAYTDPEGNVWQADSGLYNTGNAFSTTQPIAGTTNPVLYRSERYDTQFVPEMVYSLPVDPGIYTVKLHLAEIYFTSQNQRVFDVRIESQLVLDNFDIVKAAGAFTAIVETFEVSVEDGTLNIQFAHVKENPKISGIEVLTQGADLTVNPESLSFGSVGVGATSPAQTVTLSNNGSTDVELQLISITGANAGDFQIASAPAAPYTLPAGDSVDIDLAFAPAAAGPRAGSLELTVSGGHLFSVALSGVGEVTPPPAVAVYRVNAGGGAYTDGAGNVWQPDTAFFNTGSPYSVNSPIAGTNDDALYQTERWDPLPSPEMVYSFPLEPGGYVVRLHFAEIYNGITGPGQRVFSVLLEGQPVLNNFDIYAEAGPLTAIVKQFNVSVVDGSLQIQFVHGVENPKISAIEILGESAVTPSVSIFDWGHVLLNTPGGVKTFSLTNNGDSAVTIDSLGFLIGSGTAQDFRATINGTAYAGAAGDLTYPVNIVLGAGASTEVSVTFTPTVVSENDVALTFSGGFGSVAVQLLGTGEEYIEDPYLHAVIEKPAYFIDYDQNGFEVVFLRGDLSHTHELGHSIVAYQWSINGVTVATTANMSYNFPVGGTTVMLTIWDNNVPPNTNSTTAVMTIMAPDDAPGTLVEFYDSKGANPATLLDAVPAAADYGTKMTAMYIGGGTPTVVPSPFTGNVMVQFLGQVDLNAGTYQFGAVGGSASRLFLNGAPVTGPVSLAAGRYLIDARFAIPTLSYLPIYVGMSVNGGPFGLIPGEITTHSQLGLRPIINTMPTEGGQSGGYQVAIFGMGFVPLNSVVVHWGGTTIANQFLTVQSSAVRFIAPPGSGTINVSVENPYGVSNVRTFTYVPVNPIAIDFSLSDVATNMPLATVATWGSDGRLYVGTVQGLIHAFALDDDYNVLDTQTIPTVQGLSNPNILGITSNPFDSGGPVKLYVSHSELFANGGTCFSGFSPYSGQVSVLTGPDFATAEPVITGLPVSNHDHGVNALEFDNNGDLLICVGGVTNAGIFDCDIGGLNESPLTGAILKAQLSKPGFNGAIGYVETATGAVNMDQTFGAEVDVAAGVDVEVFAAGFRNTFDLTLTPEGLIYCTDNGPNLGFGPASTGPNTQTPGDVETADSLNLVEYGNYYGHPNRNRGRYDVRQNVWYDLLAPGEPGVFTQMLAEFPSSTDGICAYAANTFGGAMRGDLILQQWNTSTYRATLDSTGAVVLSQEPLPVELNSLDIVQGPGGAILGVSYAGGKVVVAKPVEPPPAAGIKVYDILPWRASAAGGKLFVIGGAGFGAIADTSVTIGELACTITSVTPTRIKGSIPANPSPTVDLLDVTVSSGSSVEILAAAFRYLVPPGP